MTKSCSKCEVIKPLSDFHACLGGKFGVRADCKECVKKRQKSIKVEVQTNGSKKCTKCLLEKLMTDFPLSSTIMSGRRSICITCKRLESSEYQRTHKKTNHRQHRKNYINFRIKEKYRSRKRNQNIKEILIKIKSNPCKDCSRSYPAFCMDFDHVDPKNKRGNIRNIKSTPSKKHIMEEIDKCDLVCVNCHRKRTADRRGDDFYSSTHESRSRVSALLFRLKSNPCLDCKNNFHPSVMDFDHVRGKKLGTICSLSRRLGSVKLLQEIIKCDLVCACCHRIRTQSRLKVA